MHQEIQSIIDSEDIHTLYQPIVSLVTGEVIGYEALSRGPEWSRLFSPIALIEAAKEADLTYPLEYLFRRKAIENAHGLKSHQRLFINVNPEFIKQDHLERGITKKLLVEKNLSTKNVILEITERSIIQDYEAFNDVLRHYKSQNYKIAIDDVGAGYSGLRTIQETMPHYIKIDMELIRNIDQDAFKEALIHAFLNFSISTDIRLIAEGIETEGELTKLIEMGVHYGQGFFLQKPVKEFMPLRDDVKAIIANQNRVKHDSALFIDQKHVVGTIALPNRTILKSQNCLDAKTIIEDTECEGICVLNGSEPVGVVMRSHLFMMLSSQYGLSLYAKKGIINLMDIDFLMVDYNDTIHNVAKKAMSRERDKLYDLVVVTKNGAYHGVIYINNLLLHLMGLETKMAQEMNPLTKLPGNITINRVLNDIVTYQMSTGIVYVDLDYFKPYNDVYGFEMGDSMLKHVSDVLVKHVKQVGALGGFVGHIGGDDFIFIVECDRDALLELCDAIIKSFTKARDTLFNQSDLEGGCFISNNRSGNQQCFPLTTMSLAGIFNNIHQFTSVNDLSQRMSVIKKAAKEIEGNSVVIE